MKRLTACFVGFFLAGSLFAQQTSIIIFGNGLSTVRKRAQSSLDLLEQAYADHLGVSVEELRQTIDKDLAYNTTECPEDNAEGFCLPDWYESLIQAAQQNGPVVVEDIWRFILASGVPIPPTLQQTLETVAQHTTINFPSEAITEGDLTRHVDLYRDSIGSGKKVVLVAHSQGNFFANQSYDLLSQDEQRSFGVISVATPASFVAGDGPYRTSFTDFIYTVPGALLPNTLSGPSCTPGWGCHAFKQYIGGTVSGPQILDDIDDVLASLEVPGSGEEVVPDTLVGVDVDRDVLVIINPETRALTDIGPIHFDAVTAIASNPDSSELYGVDQATGLLIGIDRISGGGIPIGPVGLSNESPLGNSLSGMTFGPGGVLYGMTGRVGSTSRLITINTQTGAGSVVSDVIIGQSGGLAYDRETNRMFTVGGGGVLLEVNPQTGTVTFLNTGFNRIIALADIPGSTDLYALRTDPVSPSRLLLGRIDTTLPFPVEGSFGYLPSGVLITSIGMVVIPPVL